MIDIYIINESGTEEVFKSAQPTDESYHLRELQGKDECEIKLELPEYVDFPLGCYITWKGNKYTLCAPAQIEKNGTRKLSYTLTFSGALKSLAKYRMRHIVSSILQDSKLDFSITAYPHEILQMIVDNINYRESGWSVGKCEPTSMVTQTYSMTTVEQALANLAEECDTEYEIDGKTIHLRKVEYNKSNPISLQYGKGGGFIPGVARKNASDTNPMEILFVQGGEQNIDSSKYGCTTLLMPSNSGMIVYYDGENYRFVNSDGTATEDDGFNADNARAYKVSTDRMSIERADVAKSSYSEGAMTDTDIYPKRVGTVTAVINEDDNPKKVLFQDSSIPETLNYKELTAAGSSLNVVFNSGMLTGKTFEVNYNHTRRQFAMVGTTIDDVAMPDETWRPAVGDEFVILNMVMPTDYLYNHTLHTGAEYDLLRAAVKYMYENEDDKYTFEGTLDTIWSKANWESIGGMIKPGGYVKFIDPQFEAAGVSLRITSVKESINNPYAPTIEISNSQNSSSVSSKIAKIEATTPVAIETAKRAAENFANRGFAAVKETTDMLSEQFEGYTESITPVSVQTMQTIVGDESLQYAFYATENGTEEVAPAVNYDSSSKTVTISYYDTDTTPYYLRHKTLGVTTMSTADYDGNTLKQWALYSFTSGDLDESKSYYIYVKAPTDTTEAATFLFSDTAKQMEDETGYYLLLFGFLNKPDTSGARSFAQMYGYSEILPGRITTDKVVSQDGKTGFDLVNGRIYGNIEFNASEDNTALINNIINANTIVTGAASSATSALSTAKEALAKAEEAAGEVNPNLLRGTEYMRIGDGTWESASFRQDGYGGTLSYVSDIKAETGEAAPIDGLSGAIKITANYDWADNDDGVEVAWIKQKNGFYQDNYTGLSKGDVVVLSAYVWSSGNLAMSLAPVWATDATSLTTTVYLKRGWNKVASAPMTLPTTEAYNLCNIYIIAQETQYEDLPAEGLICIVCGAKLEKGAEATAWCEANEDKNYLKEAIAEATQGTTTLGGGLVLSKYMGVKDSSGVIVAGMSGTSQATAGTLPMIWAGATANSTDGQKAAAFRVNGNSGEVVMTKGKIVGGEGSNGMVIENGTIKLGTVASETIPDNKVNMLISPTTGMTSISTIINATSTADVSGTLADPSSTSASQSWVTSGANGLFDTEAVTKTATLWSKTIGTSVKAGTLYFSFNEKNLAATLTESATLTAGNGKSAYLYLQSSYEVWVENGSSKATLLKGEIGQTTSSGVNPSKTATVTGTYSTMASVLFSPGDTIAIKATTTVQAGGAYSSSSSTASVSATLAASATLAIKFNSAAYSSKIPVYNNHYFGNGFMLSTASNKYLAASSAATDGNIIQARSSNALFKFTANGLLQSMNGVDAFYRVSPVVMAFSLSYNSTTNKYTIISHYNPFGKTMGNISRDSAGKITVNHNYGDWTFTFATAIDATYSVFCKVVSFTSTSVTIGRIDRDGNYRDGNFQVMLFDFHTY